MGKGGRGAHAEREQENGGSGTPDVETRHGSPPETCDFHMNSGYPMCVIGGTGVLWDLLYNSRLD